MVELGKKLSSMREKRNLTQMQVAKQIGVSKSMISSYEVGSRKPSLEKLSKLADTFSVSTDYLLGREATPGIDVSKLTDSQIYVVKEVIDEFVKDNARNLPIG